MAPDPEAFAQLEYDGWQRVADKYESAWSGLTKLFIPYLLKSAQIGPNIDVLDVACGPGYVAEAVARLGAKPIGVDFSPEMVRIASERNPRIEFREGDAQDLNFDDGSFDVVVMNFGVLHLPRPAAAFSESYRVLRPGGLFAFSLWAGPEHSSGAKAIEEAVMTHANSNVGLPEGPDYYGLGTEETARKMLENAGFAPDSLSFQIAIENWRVPSADFVFEAERDAGVRTAALLAAQTPETLDAIRSQIRISLAPFASDGGLTIPFAAHIIAIRR